MSTPTARETAAEARRAVHESLVGLPAWSADEARAKVAALEAAVRSAAFAEAAAAAAGCSDDLTPEEERPGYDGPTIDPEDRLREAIDPRVDLGRRERVIAEHRQMVTDEIVAKLQLLATAEET